MLLGFILRGFAKTKKRKSISRIKHYLFATLTFEPSLTSIPSVEINEKTLIYNNLASLYDRLFFVLKPGHIKGAKFIKEHNIKDVLEVGIGTGLSLEHYCDGTTITGVDMSEGMLQVAEKKLHDFPKLNVTLKQMDAQNMDFEDNFFTCTYAPSLLSVVPEPKLLLSEMLRVTKVGGYIIIISHFQEDGLIDSVFSKVTGPFTQKLFGFKMDLNISLIEELKNIKIIENVKVNRVGLYHLSHIVIAQKLS